MYVNNHVQLVASMFFMSVCANTVFMKAQTLLLKNVQANNNCILIKLFIYLF